MKVLVPMKTYFPGEVVSAVVGECGVFVGVDKGMICGINNCTKTVKIEQSGMNHAAHDILRRTLTIATKAAVLCGDPKYPFNESVLWSTDKKYSPVLGDLVVGIVTHRFTEFWKVDINAPFEATLHSLSFNNATKRNTPRLDPGHVVYCIVTSTARGDDVALSCISVSDCKSWTSGEAYLGPLTGNGYVVAVPIAYAASLIGENSLVLDLLGKQLKFEVAIGLNGWIWVVSPSIQQTLAVGRVLESLPKLEASKTDRAHLEALVNYTVRHCRESGD